MSSVHAAIFDRFEGWVGECAEGTTRTYLGVVTPTAWLGVDSPGWITKNRPERPEICEEYFEWVDVLESVDEARDRFTLIELGAGFGYWLANGAAAARQRDLEVRLIGVEAEPTHFRWLKEHLRTNGIPSASYRLIEAAVAPTAGSVRFHVGDPAHWYGQAIEPNAPDPLDRYSWRDRIAARWRPTSTGRGLRRVKAVTLDWILRDVDFVDLLDIAIQGAEAGVLASARDQIDAKVRRAHVAIHSPEIETEVRTLFRDLGWECRWDWRIGHDEETPYGTVRFQDGLQTWLNPRLAPGYAEKR